MIKNTNAAGFKGALLYRRAVKQATDEEILAVYRRGGCFIDSVSRCFKKILVVFLRKIHTLGVILARISLYTWQGPRNFGEFI